MTKSNSKPWSRGEGQGSSHSCPGSLQEHWDLKEVAVWPVSSARGCHELVTSHNLVDPGRAEGLTLRGPAGLAPVRSSALLLQVSLIFVFHERCCFRK